HDRRRGRGAAGGGETGMTRVRIGGFRPIADLTSPRLSSPDADARLALNVSGRRRKAQLAGDVRSMDWLGVIAQVPAQLRLAAANKVELVPVLRHPPQPGAAPKMTLTNVPPMLASPPESNLIAFDGNVLTIPD
ncbi:MAG: hypothetical protein ACXW2G_14570, partial [Burkholderiaceae bacterium]